MNHSRLKASSGVLTILMLIAVTVSAQSQAGFPDSLRWYSDNGTVPFRVGTAITLQGGPSRYPVNGYQPGLLTGSPQDRAYQTLIRSQFNQIEAGNETKMMSLWTGGASRVGDHYVAKTNLFDPKGPLARLCVWAEAQRPRLTVRGHCMVYNQGYTLPTFPVGQQPLFVSSPNQTRVLNPAYTPDDMRDMLQSYVQQVVDATMAQNAAARTSYGSRVIEAWDVTNEVVSEDPRDLIPPNLGFAYRNNDPWYNNGPHTTDEVMGYDYVSDIYRWATEEMTKDIGRTILGHQITSADKFALYYNDFNIEGNQTKLAHVLNMIQHIRSGQATVDGLGFQAHVVAMGLDVGQFDKNIATTIAAGLRFSITEADCAIREAPRPGDPSVAVQEINQGKELATIMGLCVSHKSFCDSFQLWGATDDGSWIPNGEATPFTRWVKDTRHGTTEGHFGYWPKEGQFDPETLCDPDTGALDPNSGHTISSAYDQILAAVKAH